MESKRTYMKCDICGNFVGMINDSGVVPECCGQPMRQLAPNTVDAAQEKHVPEIKRDGNTVTVTVGTVKHPMTPEHYIEWIALAQGNHTQRIALTPADQPEAVFNCKSGPIVVYAYCNLHELWVNEQ